MTDRLAQLIRLAMIDPSDAEVHYSIAMEHQKRDEHDLAIAAFDRAIAADADLLYAYYHKARSQQAAGDPAAAKDTLMLGRERARTVRDEKASGEIEQLLSTMG